MLKYKMSDQLEIIRYTNPDFVRCQNNMKPTSAYIYLLAGVSVFWKNTKVSLITFFIIVA